MDFFNILISCGFGLSISLFVYYVIVSSSKKNDEDYSRNYLEISTKTEFQSVLDALSLRLNLADSEKNRDKMDEYSKLTNQAGGFWDGLNGEQILACQYLFAICLPVVSVIILFATLPQYASFDIVGGLIIVTAFVGYIYPANCLADQISKRKKLFLRQLPGALDLLRIATEAGMNLRGAFEYLSNSYIEGPVRQEFNIFLEEIRVGSSTHDSIINLIDRVNIDLASAIFSSIIQSMEMGTAVNKVLADSANDMRSRSTFASKEKANKAGVKMVFPIVLLIVPCLLIIILAPHLIKFSSLF